MFDENELSEIIKWYNSFHESWPSAQRIHQKGIQLNHDFYVVIGKQCYTENAYDGSPIQYLYIN